MLANRTASRIVSHLGWVDQNRLWVYDGSAAEPHYLPIETEHSFTIHEGRDDHFALLHFFPDNRVRLCVHQLTEPQTSRAELLVDDRGARFSGDSALWGHIPSAYRVGKVGDYEPGLLLIDAEHQTISVDPLRWFDAAYHQGDKLLTGVTEVPGTKLVLFSVRYDPHFPVVLYDTRRRQLVRKLVLSERTGGGDSLLRFRNQAELWATDAGTLLRLDPASWQVRDSLDLDPWRGNRSGRIGGYSFSADGSLCVAPRTLRGDVVALDADGFRETHTAKLGDEPLEAALLNDGTVIARDWHSGKLLRERLQPV